MDPGVKTILITGGAGYIGSIIGQTLLDRGHNVRVIDALWFGKDTPLFYSDNPSCVFVKGDIRDPLLLDNILDGVDYVVHAAAVVGEPASNTFPELTQSINYEGSIKLIEKAQIKSVKGFIFLSTCSNYGISEDIATEDSSLMPLSVYARTKVDVERYLMDSVKRLDWVICRLSTAYGVSPRMRFDLTVNDFTMNAVMEKYLNLFLPFSRRPYTHVSDIAKTISKIIDNFGHVKNNVLNIGFAGENYQKIRIAEIVRGFISDTRIEIVEKRSDMRDYEVDFSKLKKCLDIKNDYTVKDGVREVMDLLRSGKIGNPKDRMYCNIHPMLEGAK